MGEAQDKNAASLNESAEASRVTGKASTLYVNSSWDIVDAVENEKMDLEKVPAEELPKVMQTMSVEERKKYVEKLALQRKELQKEINKLNVKRIAYQKKEMGKQGIDESKSFDAQLRRAIQTQGKSKGLTFKEK